MRNKSLVFLASILLIAVFVIAPATANAQLRDSYGEFGAAQVGKILDDYMLKSKFVLAKGDTIESQNVYKDGSKNIVIAKTDRVKYSPELTITTDANDIITRINFQYFIKQDISNDSRKRLHDAWSYAVKGRYGNPTEEGIDSKYGFPYSRYVEIGKYQYDVVTCVIDGRDQPSAARNGITRFSIYIGTR
ncbi:hypothetical protein [Sporomusa aerivorans]|uniref:hypothetical protein n=1 Tax=Sporomusa aerivorans TaxID=204936 RepID=UPI00352B57A0